MKSRRDVFEYFNVLSIKVRALGAIVQNSGHNIEDCEIEEWGEEVDNVINELIRLKIEIKKLAERENNSN